VRRRPVPVNTSTRCAGLVLASLAVIILNLAAQTSPKLSDHDLIRKVMPAHRLQPMHRIAHCNDLVLSGLKSDNRPSFALLLQADELGCVGGR
jgi:hypothetical protein